MDQKSPNSRYSSDDSTTQNAQGSPYPNRDSIKRTYSQRSHGFKVRDAVAYNNLIGGGSWVKAIDDGTSNRNVVGLVSFVDSDDTFTVTTCGYFNNISNDQTTADPVHGLTKGKDYYLSSTTAGTLTTGSGTIHVCTVLSDYELNIAIYGNTTATSSHVYQIIGGNTLPWVASGGIKHITTEFTTTTVDICGPLGTPTTLPDGLGWGRSCDDNTFTLICNDKYALTKYDLIPQPVVAVATVKITGNNGVIYTAYRPVGPV